MWSQTSCSPKQRHEKTGSLWPGFRKKTTPGRSPFCAAASSNRLDNHKGCRGFPALRENGGQVWSATGRAVREAEWAHCCRARSPFGVFPCIRIKRDGKQLRPEILRKRTKKRSCKQIACRTAFCVSCVKISGLHRRFLMSPRLLGALFFCAVLGHPKREAKIRKNNYIICLTSYF